MLHAQRSEGRFFGRRVNCEQVPVLPAWVVAQVFDDPEETPYLLVWKDSAGTVQECVHITAHDSAVRIATTELRIWPERDVEMAKSRSNATMGRRISSARCCGHSRETAEASDFSFVRIV